MKIGAATLPLLLVLVSAYLTPAYGTPSITIDLVYSQSVAPAVPFKLDVNLVNPKYTNESVHNPSVTGITLQRVTESNYAPANVTVTMPTQRPWESNDFPPDGKSYSLGQYTLVVSANTTFGQYLITVVVRYQDGSGWNSKSQYVEVGSQSSSPSPSPASGGGGAGVPGFTFWSMLIGLALGLAVLTYRAHTPRARRFLCLSRRQVQGFKFSNKVTHICFGCRNFQSLLSVTS